MWPLLYILLHLAAAGQETQSHATPETIRELLREDSWREALTMARRSVERQPDDPRYRGLLGQALFRAGRLEECDRVLSALASAAAPPPMALVTLARLRSAEGRYAPAVELADRALRLAPEDRDVLYWAGDLHGDRERALDLLRRYLAHSEGDDPDRVEAVRGTVRVFEALGDRETWIARRSPDRVELPLTPVWDRDGTITGYVVRVEMGSRRKPVRLLLDTGSHRLFLVERMARKGGFQPLAEKTLVGGGGDRRHVTRPGIVDRIAIGRLEYADAVATTTREEFDPTGRFHGLLGISAFGGYRVTLDLASGRLVLERRNEPVEGDPYWWISGQMLVRAEAGPEHSGLFVLDTGAERSAASLAFVERVGHGLLAQSAPVRGFGGVVEGARLVRGMTIAYQGRSTGGRPLVAYDRSAANRVGGVEVDGLVGLDLLAGTRVTIDTRAQRIRIDEGE